MATSRDVKSGSPGSAVSALGALLTLDQSPSLWRGRKFRAYREFSADTTLKLVATKPFLLAAQRLWTGQGAARVVITTGSTESGTFTAIPTQFPLNTKDTPVPVSTVSISAGGTVTGGTEREVLRSDSSSAGGGSGNSDLLSSPRLLAAGTYYITITITGTTAGMYALEWEDLDS